MVDVGVIEQQAAEWLIREDRGLDLRERAEFESWLSGNLQSRVAYLRLKRTWHNADQLSCLRTSVAIPRASLVARFGSTLPKLAAAAVVLATVGIGARYFLQPTFTVVSTGIGQQRTLSLSDGTRIELDTNTSLKTREAGSTRTVMLERGQVYFDVAHDEHHPFVVIAGSRRISDLGTKFSVYRNGENIKVVVKEGKVRLDDLGANPGPPVIADINSVVIAKLDGTLMARRTSEEVERELTWRRGLLIFNDEPLPSVAREFNRYNVKQMRVAPNAQNIKIGGSFRADDVQGFKALLQQIFALKIQDRDGEIYVSR